MEIVVLSDLDGTLLDPITYSYQAASPSLNELKTRGIPLILVSSKTRAEMEPIRFNLNHQAPFIVENGGGIFIPKGFFQFPLDGTVLRGPYQVIELGTPYAKLRTALKEIAQALNVRIKGFGDMSAEEVAERTGLPHAEAILAKQREYDEPFVIEPVTRIDEVQRQAEARGLSCTKGGRFYHLLGHSDKGQACRYLIDWFRLSYARKGAKLFTVGLGDSLNDLPMLNIVDRPILVQKPDGSYDSDVRLPNLLPAHGIGPVGWNWAVLSLLEPQNSLLGVEPL